MPKTDRERIADDPNRFVEEVIGEYVAGSPERRLATYDNDPLVDEPLVGFAAGDDPIFLEFKKQDVIGDFHFTPGEALAAYLKRRRENLDGPAAPLSVISIVFTPTGKTRLSNRPESVMASPRWQYAFAQGMRLMNMLLEHLVSRLEALGYRAVSPICAMPPLFLWQIPQGPTSDWSEKHVAYAAGLGTFGLNSGIITVRGAALHCGSVITDLALAPTPRAYDSYQAHCLHYRNGSCRRCAQRCPSGAISPQGYDRRKCFFYHEVELPRISQEMGRNPGDVGHPICALCQTKVPCERGIPPIQGSSV